MKARAVSALGGGFGGNSVSAPSSLTSQQGLQQVKLATELKNDPVQLSIIPTTVPAEGSCSTHGRDPLWSLCHIQVCNCNSELENYLSYRRAQSCSQSVILMNPLFKISRRGPLGSKSGNRWFHTSDSTVKQVPFSEVSFYYCLVYSLEMMA